MVLRAGAVVHEPTLRGDSVHVLGDVDESNSSELEEVLARVVPLGRNVTIDLTRCRYIGSAALRLLLRARRNAHADFGTLVRPESLADRVLRVAKLDTFLSVQQVEVEQADVYHSDEPIRVVALEGEWDLSRGAELRRKLDRASRDPRVVLDLSGMQLIDSNCMAMIVRMRTQRVAKGYPSAPLVIPHRGVRKLFTISGLAQLWSIFDTLDEAFAALQ